MFVKLRVQVRIPYSYECLDRGTRLEVIDERGLYYICENEQVSSMFILKSNCEVIEECQQENTHQK